MINFINNNFEPIMLVVVLLIVTAQFSYLFLTKPSSKRKEIILTWLLQAVIESEKLFKSNTGQLKFSYVYDSFLKQFPIVGKFITKDLFSELVSESLEQMKHLLRTNEELRRYVEGEE